ncbi:MAG TPA: hypothetical protein ENK31_05580, partial [Nannocystis exedens]|nr:hypothetical protein [Nannocystis exedens]
MTQTLHLLIAASSLGLFLVACGDDAGGSTGTSTRTSTGASTSSDGTLTDSSSSEGSSSSSTSTGGSETGEACLEQDVELPGEMFYPEGVAAYGEILFVGSAVTGEIVRADPCSGTVENLVPAGILPGAIGLRVDAARNILWACAFDSTQEEFSSLNAFDLDSGEHLGAHSWESPGFCNDVA